MEIVTVLLEDEIIAKENKENSSSTRTPRARVGVVRRRRAKVGVQDSMELESNVESNRDSNSMEVDEEQIDLRENDVNSSIETPPPTALEAAEDDASIQSSDDQSFDVNNIPPGGWEW